MKLKFDSVISLKAEHTGLTTVEPFNRRRQVQEEKFIDSLWEDRFCH
jgi:hypothetical protein